MERKFNYNMSIAFSKEQMLDMEKTLNDFLENHNIKLSIPVDIFKLSTELGFDVRGAEFEEHLEGMILVDENEQTIEGFDSNKIIAYNRQKDIYTKKFVVAHELSHYIDRKTSAGTANIVFAERDRISGYSNDINEQRMDYIAAAILIPRQDLEQKFGDIINPTKHYSDETLCEVAATYNVSKRLADRRLKEVFHVS